MSNNGTSKELSTKPMAMIKGGGKVTHDGRGSSQSYPKGSKINMNAAGFNPQKAPASQFGLKGC